MVARELRQLGYRQTRNEIGGVRVSGADPADLVRLNLWLRCAERVKLVIADFEAHSFEALFEATRAQDWNAYIPERARFPVVGSSVRSRLHSVPDCQSIVKKAIVESLRDARGHRGWLQEDGPMCRVEVALRNDRVRLSIDSSGEGLHKRGYRSRAGDAPLRETLAAALVQLSYWHEDRLLLDPFCGSGTIPIEAALIGRRIAPGISRRFDCMKWPWLSADHWTRLGEEAMDRARWDAPLDIEARDIDPSVLEIAQANARLAGVDDAIRFEVGDARKRAASRDFGVAISNPPYGERIGDSQAVEALYRDLGATFERRSTWSHYWLSGHPRFELCFGREADRRRKLYNAGIRCYYYSYFGPPPPLRSPGSDASP